jgi:hypothetical protein
MAIKKPGSAIEAAKKRRSGEDWTARSLEKSQKKTWRLTKGAKNLFEKGLRAVTGRRQR